MISFYEFITKQQTADPLGTPAEMLARAGIWPSVPHDVVIKRLVKRWKKQVAVPAGGQVDSSALTGRTVPGRSRSLPPLVRPRTSMGRFELGGSPDLTGSP
jgi:hypothetical protein